ncbi:MAG: DUF4339 domain-containing protein [Planctomycetota bacterium]
MSNQLPRWFVRKSKKTFGPFTAQQLRQLAKSGKIAADTAVRCGEDGNWTRAQKVKGLFPPTQRNADTCPAPLPSAAAPPETPHVPPGVEQLEPVQQPVGMASVRES